jgi:hypothetical protein
MTLARHDVTVIRTPPLLFWDMTLRHWVIGSRLFEATIFLPNRAFSCFFSGNFEPVKVKALCFFVTAVTD